MISSLIHVFPYRPHLLFKVITGFFLLGGLIYIFVDWRIGIVLFIAGYFVTSFYGWVNQKNIDYFGEAGGYSTQTKAKIRNKEDILEFLRTNNRITNNDVEKLLNVSDATATRYLDELENQQKIQQIGKTGHAVYYILK